MSPAPSVSLVTSPSPRALEDALVARVEAFAASGARVAIIVPTSLLAERVQRVLAGTARNGGGAGVIAGVEILHHRRLAARLLDLAHLVGLRSAPAPRLLGPIETDALVRAALGSLPEASSLRKLAEDRPRVLLSLARTLGELREALVAPDALARLDADARGMGGEEGLAAVHAAHVSMLDGLEAGRGVTDSAGHALAAAAAARALGAASKLPWTHVLHHGSYELVGCQAELMRALAQWLPVTVLAVSGDAPTHEASRRALARWPAVRPQPLGGEPTLLDVDALFHDADARGEVRLPAPAAFPRVEAVHCRGARAEIEMAARLAAEAHLDRNVPLEDIAIVARSLEPFAGHLEAAFAAQGVPFMTTATLPLLREPWAQAASTLLELLDEDLPRAGVAEFLRSPWSRLDDKVSRADDITPDLWDAWSLESRAVRGAAAFGDDLREWHRGAIAALASREDISPLEMGERPWAVDRARRIDALAGIAEALAGEAGAWSRCARPAEHAAFLRGLFGRWLTEPAPRESLSPNRGALAASEALRDAVSELEAMERLGDHVPGAAPVMSRTRVRALIASSLAAVGLPIGRRDGGGVRVLSAMPARGIPFRELILVGLNQGSFPRRPRQDPFLRDAARLRLRSAAPSLQLKAEAREEERQIFALLLGAATDRVAVTWQRADDDGKARAASLYLREIARLALGKPHLESLTARREDAAADAALPLLALPGHPADAARCLRERSARATFRDAALEASQRARRRAAIESLAEATNRLDDSLADALTTLGVRDEFTLDADPETRVAQLAQDGVIGAGHGLRPEAFSATSLDMLGGCALRWLFERALGVSALDDEPEDGAVAAAEVGNLVHAVLEDLGRETIRRGGSPEWMESDEAIAMLRLRWQERVAELAGARQQRAPVAWQALSERWLVTLEKFIRADASRLTAMGAQVVAVEQDIEANVDLSSPLGPVRWRLRGRVDRILATPRGYRVEDYKTAPDVESHVAIASALKGQRLQGSIYALLAEEWATSQSHPFAAREPPLDEFGNEISVAFVPVHPDAESFEAKTSTIIEKYRESCHETLAVLDRAVESGSFPFRAGAHCDWCAVRAACRRSHAPSQERRLLTPEFADYVALAGKSSRALSLDAVRAKRATGRDDDEEDA